MAFIGALLSWIVLIAALAIAAMFLFVWSMVDGTGDNFL